MKTQINIFFLRKIVLIFVAVFSFVSCSNNDDKPFIPINIEFDVIGSGNLVAPVSVDISPGNYVMNNESDWIELLNKMNSVNSDTTSSFTTTNINFQTHVIIAVFDELRGNPGWLIEIESIIENENNIVIDVINLNPGSIQSAMRQPYQIVRIPITNKPILFE
ncbi:hypothetical protein [Flavobacterium orientale]|uniref:PrcB C-terminal n=1 Tax=Flavobacterium orientale TaxID=1756020 RepID=A0A917DB23_9FLAO|nr:hypothetical protein [Flavobacterium orientale]GGD20977.1 hypothetical protein GCM10011343_09310 [Flavobacterium orientale]